MNPETTTLLRLAHETLDDARLMVGAKRTRAALNRAYYAAFYAASAALASVGIAARKHSGGRASFAEHFVKTGRFDVNTARILKRASDVRERADYDASTVFETSVA